MKRYKLVILLAINLLLVLVVLGFTFTQVLNTKSHVDVDLDDCKNSNGNIPYRIQIGSAYFMCAWATKYSAIRILIGLAGILLLSLLISFLFKHRRFSFMVVSLITMLCGGFGLYSTVIDGMAIEKSKKFCEDNIHEEPSGSECNFKYFYGTVVFNFLSGLFLIISSIVSLKHRSHLFNIHDESKPLMKEDENKTNYNQETLDSNKNNDNSGYNASNSV